MLEKKLHKVGQTEDGIRCTKCGSDSFRAKRSLKGKLALGVLAPKTRVECVVCGKDYKR